MKKIINILFFIFSCTLLFTQTNTVFLINPSFEGIPLGGDGRLNTRLPRAWVDCGFAGETPPDVHPVHGGSFQVENPPSHGETYLGMVARDNDTWESVSSRLSSKLEKGQCYSFSLDLARSELYSIFSRVIVDSMVSAEYIQPLKLRIYGGDSHCSRLEFLGETALIKNLDWLSYSFVFEPKENMTHLILEVFYKTPTLIPYNGNILLDNASALVLIPCEED